MQKNAGHEMQCLFLTKMIKHMESRACGMANMPVSFVVFILLRPGVECTLLTFFFAFN